MEQAIKTSDKQKNNIEADDNERMTSLIGGGALILMGLSQRSLRGILTAIAGSGLVYQAATKKSTIKQAGQALGIGQSVKVEKTVSINRPAEDLYNFWHNFENLPTFMKHLKSVKVIDEKRSHWVAKAPLDSQLEWDAEIIKDEPNHLIAWVSVEDSPIDHSGFIRFQNSTGNRGTEVKLVIEYDQPGGVVQALLLKIFGESPQQQIGDELNRFKQLMEVGEIATNKTH